MPLPDAVEFLTRYREDGELRRQLGDAPSDEERKALVRGLGLHFTRDELDQAIREHPQELSEEVLAGIAGGLADGTATVRYLA